MNKKQKTKISKKGILIVGAGVLQIAAVEKAKQLGYTVYITDLHADSPAVQHADYFFKLSTKDIEGHMALAKKLKKENKIEAVYTQGCDVEYTVAMAARAAKLPGINPEAALNCNDKSRTRKILNEKKVDFVKYATAKTEEEAMKAVNKIGFPCIIKPLDNSASRGLKVLNSESEVPDAFKNALKTCFMRKEIIIEEFLKGEEYSVDTVIFRGKLFPAGISDRQFRSIEKYCVQVGSLTPSLLPAKNQADMYELMDRAAKALGVDNGAFKGDLILIKGKPKIIEVTARTSGGFDAQYRKPYSFGIDIIKATIDIAAGKELDPIDLVPKWVKWSKTTSVFPKPGRIVRIKGLKEIEKLKGVKNIFYTMKIGDFVKDYIDCASRINHIIIVADTYEKLNALENKIHETLIIETE
ncbi:MAG: ATP-grasp domain-containing protein [Nanoarchaeota archaeon]|nr:ATP-grasp domain-containing protein [Nanoarchaeota archaeon]MBU1321064.1 ATP-grasp domain-containing protein [Nanoarchaeota archaeon]MBU1597070.1 ATP-grasp domain-containing protein [Nanoarchaeota archaeon]MBU2440860.1 ATP-grasp domain-containing protein [Nanoarchaeota archaeon]